MRWNDDTDNGVGLLGILLAIVIVLGALWYIFGEGMSRPTITATPGEGIIQPPPTTPITPRSPE